VSLGDARLSHELGRFARALQQGFHVNVLRENHLANLAWAQPLAHGRLLFEQLGEGAHRVGRGEHSPDATFFDDDRALIIV
jgi:hypothetical protein